jgi:hypothetical protein
MKGRVKPAYFLTGCALLVAWLTLGLLTAIAIHKVYGFWFAALSWLLLTLIGKKVFSPTLIRWMVANRAPPKIKQ